MKTTKRILSVLVIGLLLGLYLTPAMASNTKVNINTDSKKELVTLKHVGDKIADRIIEYRKNHPFTIPEDIMRVKGVGEKVFDANKGRIIVQKE